MAQALLLPLARPLPFPLLCPQFLLLLQLLPLDSLLLPLLLPPAQPLQPIPGSASSAPAPGPDLILLLTLDFFLLRALALLP